MNLLTSSVPTWVSVSFILTFPLFFYLIANVAKQAAQNAGFDVLKTNKIHQSILVFGVIYLIYVSLMSFTGIFTVNALPPRILLFTSIPLLLFYFGFIFRTKTYWTLLENASLQSLIRVHIFRLVGVFFLISWVYGALPQTFAFIGGFGDIFAAVTAIFVANAVEKKKSYSAKLALVWNIIGFWDIVNVIVAAFIFSKIALAEGSKGISEFGAFPFCWIPAAAPATIIFLHISIFKKLKMTT